MKILKIIASQFFILCFLFTFSMGAETVNNTPEGAVRILLNEIKQIVNGEDLSEVEKAANQKHSKIALSVFKVSEISQKALGKYWSKHSIEEQKIFKELLADLFVHVAFPSSSKFFANLDLIYDKSKSKKDMMVVPLTVVHEKEGEVDIDFRMKKSAEKWLVVDVILDGVSMRNNLRGQFYKILKKNDFNELVRRMKKKLKEVQL